MVRNLQIELKKRLKKIKDDLNDWNYKHEGIKQVNPKWKSFKRRELIGEVYLIKDMKEKLIISGGGRILLYLAVISGATTWKEYENQLIKEKKFDILFEVKKFRHRQKIFGNIDLFPIFRKWKYPQKIIENWEDN